VQTTNAHALLTALLLVGSCLAGEKDPPPTEGLAWFKRLEKKASVSLASEDTLLVRKKRRLSAYSLSKGEERWKAEVLLASVELEVSGDLILERMGRQGLSVRDLHQGTKVELGFQVGTFAAGRGRFFLSTGERLEARSIQGEVLWTFPKKNRKLPAKLDYIMRLKNTAHGLLVAGKRFVICLNDKGKPRWDYELKEPEPIQELFVDEEGLVFRSATHLHFLDGKRGKRRARVSLGEGQELRPGDIFALPAKRNRTLVVRRRLGKEGASFAFYDFKGKLRTETGGLRDGCRGGPQFQVVVQREEGYRVQSPAGKRLFEGQGQLVPSAGARESYVRQSTSAGQTLLERLEPKRGKVEAKQSLEGEWRLLQIPGALVARRGKELRLHDPQSLELRSEATLPQGGARLIWSGRTLLFVTKNYFGALPTP
jgi:hypothetical protein